MPSRRLQADPMIGLKSHGRGFRLPSRTKFQSGHLPSGIVPVSRTIPVSTGNEIESKSDMDTSSDSESEVYGGRYSIETSPQDDKLTNGSVVRKGNSVINGGKDYAGLIHSQTNGTSEIYYFNSHLEPNVKTATQVFHGTDNDIPSAPPLFIPVLESNQVAKQFKIARTGVPTILAKSDGSTTGQVASACNRKPSGANEEDIGSSARAAGVPSSSLPVRMPTFHASGLGTWYGFVSYEACVRLCLHAWARECTEAPFFLDNECAVLRDAFGVKHALLQSEEELLTKRSTELITEGASVKPKKTFGKMKVQVRKVKMVLDPPTGCSIAYLKPPMKKLESVRVRLSSMKSILSSEWESYRKVRVPPRLPSGGTFSHQSLAYMNVGTKYIKELPELLKIGATALRNSSASFEVVQDTYSCLLRLKSLPEEESVRMQPGSGETRVFLPEGLGDDLIIEINDSNGKYCGRVVAQVADIADDPGDKLRWWSMYREPEHELVGRVQLYINYSTSLEDNNLKCGLVAETVAYDFLLETAMKVQQFRQRNLLLHGTWRWLVTEFASYFGVSDAYTRLRYLSYVMDVATPTSDCLDLVHDLLLPVIMRGRTKETLSHQENRILGEVSDHIEQIIAMVFENYKSLDESFLSGIADTFTPATGSVAPTLAPALKIYKLLNDILSSEAQLKLCRYFQVAAKMRSKMHLAETDEFVSNAYVNLAVDPLAFSTAYQKMKALCLNIRNEIFTDIEIQNQHIIPSPVKGDVDAKELYHGYITIWIQKKRLALLEVCKT